MPFTGLTTDGQFTGIYDDISDMIGMIAPYETPLLDLLATPERAATNVYHEWMEDDLSPNTITSSSVTTPGATAIGVHKVGVAIARYLQPGVVLKNNTTGEFMQVSSTNTNTIVITRAFGGTSAATIAAGDTLFVIADAALEGADVTTDISHIRARKGNYTQIIKKDVIVSGTMQAVNGIGTGGNEQGYQELQRMKEALRDLEKAVINGKASGNSIGSASAYRTMKGLWDFITTNASSYGTLTETNLNNVIQNAWTNGGTDVDIIIADANYKRVIDQWPGTRIHQYEGTPQARMYANMVSYYQSTFGVQTVVLGRWMPANSLMVISSQRVRVVPLQGRSFQRQSIAQTGDSLKSMVIGEYTLEVKNEEGLAKYY